MILFIKPSLSSFVFRTRRYLYIILYTILLCSTYAWKGVSIMDTCCWYCREKKYLTFTCLRFTVTEQCPIRNRTNTFDLLRIVYGSWCARNCIMRFYQLNRSNIILYFGADMIHIARAHDCNTCIICVCVCVMLFWSGKRFTVSKTRLRARTNTSVYESDVERL